MKAGHLEILVEESSMEAFLRAFLPRVLGERVTFSIYPSRGKQDLLKNLPARLRAYSRYLPATWRIVVVVDRDDDDCRALKKRLDEAAKAAGLKTRQRGREADWRVVSRIAVEELEAWYFGDWSAVAAVYPGVSATLDQRAAYRDPDDIRGGTWEAFEKALQKAGYYEGGLSKTDAARQMGSAIVPERNRSRSFLQFCDVLRDACG